MKKMAYLFAALLAFLSCAPTPAEQEKVSLSSNVTSLEFAAEGGEQTFVVTASEKVYAVPDDDWFSVSRGATSADHKTVVTVDVEKNTVPQVRESNIFITAGEESLYVKVKQAEGVPEENEDSGNNDDGPVVPEKNDNLAWKYAKKFGLGWNLGNHFDAHSNGVSSETVWGNPKATQATFDKLKAAGFTTVRIPVTWMGHIGDAPEYKIEEEWLNRVAEVVGYAEKAGLNAIVNIHHDGADSKWWLNIASAAKNPDLHQQILQQVGAMWGQIAEKFKDKGDFLMFEAFNEIHDGKWGWGDNRTDNGQQYRCLNDWNQAFVDAVRAAGGENANRVLGIPAYCTNVDISLESFLMPTDSSKDLLMISVHCYDPYDYTLAATKGEWGHTADGSKKVAGDNEGDLKRVFETIYKNYISKGIPVYMGEFGCVNRATEREQAYQQYYLKYYAKLLQTYGVPGCIWDNGAKGAGEERHAFIDHGTGEYCSPEAKAAIEAMISSYGSAHTLEEIYNGAPR